jgi:hypothetical protein
MLVEVALKLYRDDCTGISILEPNEDLGVFGWYAIVGAFGPNLDGMLAGNLSPCGTVLNPGRPCSSTVPHGTRDGQAGHVREPAGVLSRRRAAGRHGVVIGDHAARTASSTPRMPGALRASPDSPLRPGSSPPHCESKRRAGKRSNNKCVNAPPRSPRPMRRCARAVPKSNGKRAFSIQRCQPSVILLTFLTGRVALSLPINRDSSCGA